MASPEDIKKDTEDILANIKRIAEESARWETQTSRTQSAFGNILGSLRDGITGEIANYIGLGGALDNVMHLLNKGSQRFHDEIEGLTFQVNLLKQYTSDLQDIGADPRAVKVARDQMGYQESILELKKSQMDLADKASKYTSTNHFLILGTVGLLAKAVLSQHRLNEELRQAVSHEKERNRLMQDTLEVAAEYGALTGEASSAAAALVSHGLDMRDTFQENLRISIMMQRGLGVSAETTAEMARIYEVGLKADTREVADSVARIAEQTSLAADEAARFQTEIGRSIQAMGPGLGTEAAKVSEYITTIEGKLKDLGGSQGDLVKMFQTLSGGGTEGFKLRGLLGITSPGQLASAEGMRRASERLLRLIDSIATSAPGTAHYAAQLKIVSDLTGMSTVNLSLYAEALRQTNKVTQASLTLEQRYEQQMNEFSASTSRLFAGLVTLTVRGAMPLITILTPVVKGFADFVEILTAAKPAVYTVTAAIGGVMLMALSKLGMLSKALLLTAAASVKATLAERQLAISRAATGTTSPTSFLQLITSGKFAQAMGKSMGVGLSSIGFGTIAIGGYVLLQKLVELTEQNNANNALETQYKIMGRYGAGLKDRDVALQEIKRAAVLHGAAEAERVLRHYATSNRVKGLVTEKGLMAFIEMSREMITEAREVRGLRQVSVTGAESQDAALLQLFKDYTVGQKKTNELLERLDKRNKAQMEVEKAQDDRDHTRQLLDSGKHVDNPRSVYQFDYFNP